MKKIALTGGGTGGHITPNLALIPELKKRKFDIIYIGSSNGMEKDIMEREGIPFFGITTDKLRRYLDVKNFAMPFNVLKGIAEATKILKENKVDMLFSKGGFVAVPVVLAASRLNIPIVSHEADFTLGLANRIAVPFSKKVCCNFEETAKALGDKAIYTGCPIRQSILKGNKNDGLKFVGLDDDKPLLFVTGGSLGSQYINNLIRSNLHELLKRVNIVHQCGKGKLDNSIKSDGYRQFELIEKELADVFAASDLVISRAGANIIFELLALKKPNMLIPLSTKASRGDQILNANSFMKKNYSIVLLEEAQDQNPDLFLNKFDELISQKKSIVESMKNAIESNAIKHICDIIEKETI